MKINYDATPDFKKDLKKLSKKYRTLPEDLEVAKTNAIELYHIKKIDNESVFRIKGFPSGKIEFFKIKKFACKYLKGKGNRTGIRIIYAFSTDPLKVIFLEMYLKADQENEDKNRIKNYLKTMHE